MPTYDYRCKDCGGTFEFEQKITEAQLDKCILCLNGTVERLITGGTFILKGTGWYKTDYASSSSNTKSSSPSSSSTVESSSSADTNSKDSPPVPAKTSETSSTSSSVATTTNS